MAQAEVQELHTNHKHLIPTLNPLHLVPTLNPYTYSHTLKPHTYSPTLTPYTYSNTLKPLHLIPTLTPTHTHTHTHAHTPTLTHSHTQTPTPPHTQGQAMIELIIALVAILTIVSGLLLIVSVGTAHTKAMMEARRKAGAKAMLNIPPIESPDFILDWKEGNDGKKMTADDASTKDIPQPFNDNIVNHAAGNSAEWSVFSDINRNQISKLHNSSTPSAYFGLVKGHKHTSIPLLPVMQKLIFNSDRIDIDADVWLTHTKGIY